MKEPIWLSIARMSRGITEVPGATSNAVILQWARDIGAPSWFHDDDQPWCAVFANRVLQAAQLPMALGTRGDPFDRLRALTFAGYGQGLAGPALGAICVFARPEGAHVAFYLGEAGDLIRVFGGNQSNKVGETWMPRARLRGYRWAPGVAIPAIGAVLLKPTGEPASTNEA